MEHFEITKTNEGFHIEGFPEAVKVLGIKGPKARRLANLTLHKSDLEFSLSCLDGINLVPEEPYVLRESLWRSAVVHFAKCFGSSKSRFSLDPKTVYRGDEGAIEPFEYFRSLRNKHLVHDENSYSQALPGAILNKPDASHKIEKIVCLSLIGQTLDRDAYSNLHLLVAHALEWVTREFDQLCDRLTAELEAQSYENLSKQDGITYSAPSANAVHETRTP